MKKKKILSLILVVTLLFACIPFVTVPVSAATKTYFSTVTVTGYKGWLDADAGGQERYKQRGYALGDMNNTNNLANIKSGSAASYQTNQVGEYYPEIYLNASGELVRDNTYDNVNTDVDLSTYLSSGLGKYYAYFKLGFDSAKKLNTFTVYNRTGWWHLNRGFDILVSYDGTHWSKRGSYTNMGTYENWSNGGKTVKFGGQDCLYLTVDMGGVNAKYVAVAVTEPAGGGPCCALQYAEATTGDDAAFSVSSIAEMQSAMTFLNAYSNGGTIKLTSDITCSDSLETVGTLTGTDITLDGQNHTIYNLRKYFVGINGAGITVKNFVFSNKTSNGGSDMTITGRIHLFGADWTKIGGGTSAKPVVIENVINQRNVKNFDDYNGIFARTVGGYVTFRNCTNKGSIEPWSNTNKPIGGFVGALEDSGVVLRFESCSNEGLVRGSQAGGFVGAFNYDKTQTIEMINCTNSGAIYGNARSALSQGYGIAGGFIGSVINNNSITGTVTINLTQCKNIGNITINNIESNDHSFAVGGLIGNAGNVNANSTNNVRVTLTQCEVYGCSITANDGTYGSSRTGTYYAAGLIGFANPKNNANALFTAKNCYVSKVTIAGDVNRKFIGVDTGSTNKATVENCMMYQVTPKNKSGAAVDWDASEAAKYNRTFSASDSTYTGFADTDTDNLISGGGKSFCQKATDTNNTNKIRFVATLASGFSLEGAGYERVGFYVVALDNNGTSGSTSSAWIQQSWTVYNSINADGVVTTPSSFKSGAGYVFVLPVRNVPKNIGVVNFYVTPYMIHNDGHIIFGQSYQVSMPVSGDPTIS